MYDLSIVVPIFDEEELLPRLRERLMAVVARLRRERGLSVEVVLVDDGSRDSGPLFLAAWASEESGVRAARLSRNFGHQAALSAGIDLAQGRSLVMMDGDLQDPPELIPDLLEKAAEGHDVVFARRSNREGEGIFKRATAWLFYRLMKLLVHRDLPADTGDFRLLSPRALEALRGMREKHRFLRGMSTWIGFSQAAVEYSRPARAAGKTKYSLPKMLRFAWEAAVSFSTLPLKLATLWGLVVSFFGLGYLGFTLHAHFVLHTTVPGWSSLIVLICLTGGSILVSLGILGSYVGKIFEEAKGRPLYIVQEIASRPVDPDKPQSAGTAREQELLEKVEAGA